LLWDGNSDGMIAFRAQSSAWGKGTLMPAATFDASKLLISNKKRNRQEIKENMGLKKINFGVVKNNVLYFIYI
jgi:hypothetical protein